MSSQRKHTTWRLSSTLPSWKQWKAAWWRSGNETVSTSTVFPRIHVWASISFRAQDKVSKWGQLFNGLEIYKTTCMFVKFLDGGFMTQWEPFSLYKAHTPIPTSFKIFGECQFPGWFRKPDTFVPQHRSLLASYPVCKVYEVTIALAYWKCMALHNGTGLAPKCVLYL